MRIALVSEHASPLAVLGGVDAGGQNVHVAALASALVRQGDEVRVYTRRDHASLRRRVAAPDGYTVVHVDAGPAQEIPKDELFPHMGAFGGELVREWQRWRPEVVHAHFWMSGIASLAAAAHVGVPVVQTFHALGAVKLRHQGSADTSPSDRLSSELRLLHTVDRVIATCSDEVRELRHLGGNAARITVVPCGVDLRRFRAAGRVRARGMRTRLVAVSRLVPRKGLEDAIRSLTQLPGTELLIAGGPPAARLCEDVEALRLQALAREVGVADRVELLGGIPQREVPPLLRSADVVVAVPWYEPFGIVPVEAMACGVPVVGAAVGGLLDTVRDGETGVLVPPRDPAQLAAALRTLLARPALRRRMGAAGARHAGEYSWSHVAARTRAVYAEVAAQQSLAAAVGGS